MQEWQSLSYVWWDCKYHVMIVPKYRRHVFYGKMRRRVGEVLRGLCQRRGIELLQGNRDAGPHSPHLIHAPILSQGRRTYNVFAEWVVLLGRGR